MDNPPYDDVVMQIVSCDSSLHCSVSFIRTLPGLLLSSLKEEFLKSFVIAWIIEMPGGYETSGFVLSGATKLLVS